MRPVTVQFLKNPDTLHWGFEGWHLGEDEYGTWIAVPSGSRRWKGETPVRSTRDDAVFCAPHSGWWHLHFNGPVSNFSHFVDIVTPPVWVSENRYQMIDLDLDVVVHQNGRVEVEDEDEFAIHQVELGYTAEMVRGALDETAHIVAALEARVEPFFAVAEGWMEELARRRP
jgi:protein associated with RNAse G/E